MAKHVTIVFVLPFSLLGEQGIRMRLSTVACVTLPGREKIMRGMVVHEVSGEPSHSSSLYISGISSAIYRLLKFRTEIKFVTYFT